MPKFALVLLLLGPCIVVSADDMLVTVYLEGVQQNFAPRARICRGAVHIPLRAVAEAIGAKVKWVAERNRATISTEERHTDVNRSEGVIVDGHLLIPLQLVAEALGCQVRWDPETKTVDIRTVEIRKMAILGTCLPGCEEMWKELGGTHFYGNRFGWPDYDKVEELGMKVFVNIRGQHGYPTELEIKRHVQEWKDRPGCGGYWCDQLGHEPDITNPPIDERIRFYETVRRYDPDKQNHPVMEMFDMTEAGGQWPGWKDAFSDKTHDLLLFDCYPSLDKSDEEMRRGMKVAWDKFISRYPHLHQVIPQMAAFGPYRKGSIWAQYNYWKEKLSSAEFDNPYRGPIAVCWYKDETIRSNPAMQEEIREVIADVMKKVDSAPVSEKHKTRSRGDAGTTDYSWVKGLLTLSSLPTAEEAIDLGFNVIVPFHWVDGPLLDFAQKGGKIIVGGGPNGAAREKKFSVMAYFYGDERLNYAMYWDSKDGGHRADDLVVAIKNWASKVHSSSSLPVTTIFTSEGPFTSWGRQIIKELDFVIIDLYPYRPGYDAIRDMNQLSEKLKEISKPVIIIAQAFADKKHTTPDMAYQNTFWRNKGHGIIWYAWKCGTASPGSNTSYASAIKRANEYADKIVTYINGPMGDSK